MWKMGQWSGGSPGQPYGRGTAPSGATYTPGPAYTPRAVPSTRYPAPSSFLSGSPGRAGRGGSSRALQLGAVAVVVVLLAGLAVLVVLYVGANGKLTSTRSALRGTRARLSSVLAALSTDTKALVTEQQVGAYLRGVRDALVPVQQAYDASSQATTDAGIKAEDEQAIVALTEGKQQLDTLTIPDSLRIADGDLRSAMDHLAGGLQAEILAFNSQNVAAYNAALTVERQAIDHINTARGEMYAAIGTSGPATVAS